MLAGVSTRRYTRTGEPVGSEIEPMSSACERHGRATTTTALWTTPGAHRRARPQPSRRRRVAARELEETLTVTRLGVGRLKRTLASTNPCESMIETVRRISRNVSAGRTATCGCAGPPLACLKPSSPMTSTHMPITTAAPAVAASPA
jgi:hypothetical protein